MKIFQKTQSIMSIDLASDNAVRVVLKMRIVFASLMMMWFIVVSVSASLKYGVLGITAECITPIWLFVLTMLPETIQEARTLLKNKLIFISILVLGVCCATWFIFEFNPYEPRLRFMVGVALLFPAAVGWFRLTGDKGIKFAILVKIAVLMFSCYLIGSAIVQSVPAWEIFIHPPIYRHLRHFNYDLAIVAALIGGLVLDRSGYLRWLLICSFFVLGYFSFWSGGRGQLVALVVVVGLLSLGVTKRTMAELRLPIKAVAAFLLGGVFVLMTGQSELMLGALDRSSREGLNAVSSGRLAIWVGTLATGSETVVGALFGHGPESFVRLAVFKQFKHYITHPHNTIIQWVFEYGLIGASALMAIYINLALRCVWPALFSANKLERLSSAAVIGMTVFSLFDGIFYHAAPLLFMTLLWAYLYSRDFQHRWCITQIPFLLDIWGRPSRCL